MNLVPKSKLLIAEFDPSNRSVKSPKGWSLFETIFQHECKKCHICFHEIPMSTQEIFSSCFKNSRSFQLYKVYADLRRRGFKVSQISSAPPSSESKDEEVGSSPPIKRQKMDFERQLHQCCLKVDPRVFLTLDHLKSQEFIQSLLYKNIHIKSWNQMRFVQHTSCEEKLRGQIAYLESSHSSTSVVYNTCKSIINPSLVHNIPEVFEEIQKHGPELGKSDSKVTGTFLITDSSSNESTVVVEDDESPRWLEDTMFNLDDVAIIALTGSETTYFKVSPFEVWDEIS